MKYKVLYFTRTGNCKRIAENIAEKMSCELVEITDDRDWSGKLGYINAGRYASFGKTVNIKINGDIGDKNEFEYIVVSPVWAGKIAPAVKVFVDKNGRRNIHLITSSILTEIRDSGAYASVWYIKEKVHNEDEEVSKIIEALK